MGRLETENETIFVELHKTRHNITKQHLKCMYTACK